jgi:hypothetical protein
VVPRIVSDAVKRGVGGIKMYTSGANGRARSLRCNAVSLRWQPVRASRSGPNCPGIYNRRTGVRLGEDQEYGEGGTLDRRAERHEHQRDPERPAAPGAMRAARSRWQRGVLNECDYLEHFANDPLTEVVVMYIGCARCWRFFDFACRTARIKPGGVEGRQTLAGARAVQSHTASLASANSVWDALLRQANIIGTGTMEETLDVAGVLANVQQPVGRGVALIGMNGGQAVALSDQFSLAGFHVPQLSEASYQQLAEFFMVVGGSYRNPFDAASTIRREDDNLAKILEILAQDPAIDGGVGFELGARTSPAARGARPHPPRSRWHRQEDGPADRLSDARAGRWRGRRGTIVRAPIRGRGLRHRELRPRSGRPGQGGELLRARAASAGAPLVSRRAGRRPRRIATPRLRAEAMLAVRRPNQASVSFQAAALAPGTPRSSSRWCRCGTRVRRRGRSDLVLHARGDGRRSPRCPG